MPHHPRPVLLLVASLVAVASLVGPTSSLASGHAPDAGHGAGHGGGHGDRAAPTSTEKVAVTGSVRKARYYDVRQLTRRFDQREVTVTYSSGGTPETHTFTGPLLYDVALAVEPRFDPAVKNDQLVFAIVVTAADGYRATVSWGELDPGFGATEVLLATHQDGAPLMRPRLVVPGDVKGGRYVSDVRRVEVRDLSV